MREYLQKRLHSSWLVAWLSGGFIIGVALSLYANGPFTFFQSICIAFPLLLVAFARRVKFMIALALVAGLVLGIGRGSSVQQNLQAYKPFYGKSVQVTGKVSEDTVFGAQGD